MNREIVMVDVEADGPVVTMPNGAVVDCDAYEFYRRYLDGDIRISPVYADSKFFEMYREWCWPRRQSWHARITAAFGRSLAAMFRSRSARRLSNENLRAYREACARIGVRHPQQIRETNSLNPAASALRARREKP